MSEKWTTYSVILIIFEAGPPVDPSEVGGGQFDNVQCEGLLHKHDVVFGHTEAVEVARVQSGTKWNRTDLLNFPQRRLLMLFI